MQAYFLTFIIENLLFKFFTIYFDKILMFKQLFFVQNSSYQLIKSFSPTWRSPARW